MNQQIKEKWLEALRSGKYKQGSFRLRKSEGNRFCCLGVLCDLYFEDHDEDWVEGVYGWEANEIGEMYVLPRRVMEWADLDDCNPGMYTSFVPISELNDIQEYEFEELADLIEEQL